MIQPAFSLDPNPDSSQQLTPNLVPPIAPTPAYWFILQGAGSQPLHTYRSILNQRQLLIRTIAELPSKTPGEIPQESAVINPIKPRTEVPQVTSLDVLPIPQAIDRDTLQNNLDLEVQRLQFMGYWQGWPCYGAEVAAETAAPAGWEWRPLRQGYDRLGDVGFSLGGQAARLLDWDRNHRFCGCCGQRTTQLARERAKVCENCNLRFYSPISPAMITLVYRQDAVLLARAPRFPGQMYSVLAGFVEAGETLEQTVVREVQEEVGLRVKNLRYFGSQPWPFPNALMLGFVAEYAGGEIQIDPEELVDAAWFHRDNLPQLPPRPSIARRLIDWFVAQPTPPPTLPLA
ncbi:MAG: NAD(+) diphosphatase [Prochlorothrix sp.]|nr:NAD(+) diphosphatase [Prochlorothrix sp.]